MKNLKYLKKSFSLPEPDRDFVHKILAFAGNAGIDIVTPKDRELLFAIAAMNNYILNEEKSIIVIDQKNIESVYKKIEESFTPKGLESLGFSLESGVTILNKGQLLKGSKNSSLRDRNLYLVTNTLPSSNKEFLKILEVLPKSKSSVISFNESSSVDAMYFMLRATNQYKSDISSFSKSYAKYQGPVIKGKRPFMLRELRIRTEFEDRLNSMLQPFLIAERGEVRRTRLRL